MTRYISIATALAVSLLVAPSCKKEKKEDKAESSAKKGDDSAAKGSSDDKPSASATAAGDVISHFPADTEVVISFNMAGLSGSELWKKYGDVAMKDAKDDLAEFKEICGFDPITTIGSLYVGINSSKEKEVVIIAKGFERETITKCAKAVAEKEGKKIEIVEEGNFTFVTNDGDKTGMIWLDGSTVLMVPEKATRSIFKLVLMARIASRTTLHLPHKPPRRSSRSLSGLQVLSKTALPLPVAWEPWVKPLKGSMVLLA